LYLEELLFFSLFISSYVHTLFGPFLTPAPTPSLSLHPLHFQAEPVLPFPPILLKSSHSNNKKDIVFLLVEIRIAIQRFLALLPCTIHVNWFISIWPLHYFPVTFPYWPLLF
jgi:hypothetical protein